MAEKTIFEPAGGHILVVDSPRTTEIAGIELPGNVRSQEMAFGTVVFCGPDAKHTKPEDRICYGPYAGKNVVIDGIEFRVLIEEQIEGYIRKVAEGSGESR